MSELQIHRFWAGPRDMPEEYVEYGEKWDRLNPGYSMRMWGEDDIAEFPDLKRVFDSLYERDAGRQGVELYVQMADVMGYSIIHKYGGVYVNTDMEPVKPLPELPYDAWASYENDIGDVVNAAIGASRPRTLFWSRVVRTLPGRYFASPSAEMVTTTGPGLLTDMARKMPKRIHLFPQSTFNPVHWSKIPLGTSDLPEDLVIPEDTVALHRWGHRRDQRTNYVESATQ